MTNIRQTENKFNGYFIAIDGGNGTGKSSVIQALAAKLKAQGLDVLITREPGGTVIGEKTRHLLLDTDHFEITPMAELLLFSAARAQHFEEKIKPALEKGKLVLSDRFSAATVAFQGYAQGTELSLIQQANELAVGAFKPNLNLILDLDPAIGMQRLKGRGALDRHEQEAIAFHEKARQGYLSQALEDPDRFAVIDASQSPEYVFADVVRSVDFCLFRDGITPR